MKTPPAGQPPQATRGRLSLLALEFLLVFCALPLAAALPALARYRLPALLAVAALCAVVLLRDPTFDRRRLWNAGALQSAADGMMRRAFGAAIVLFGAVAAVFPERLLDLPRERPLAWVGLVVVYLIAVAWPLEIVYRAFLMHRYRSIFGEGALAVAASAVAFSFLQVAKASWIALAVALVAGALLARTYRRSGSLGASTLEHAAYAVLVLGVGLGKFFVSGR
jgi:membrane protease YdiL (CAAX protease family)